MNKLTLFGHLVSADLKRTKKYIPSVLGSMIVLLTICSIVAVFISKHVYKDDSFTKVTIAYYIPDDDDKKYNNLALGMLQDMRSMQETAELVQVTDIDEGYDMVDKGEVLYLIIVPANFYSGIMDSTNPRLKVVFRDNSSITSFITNELLMSYASYLGIAQSAVYSGYDVAKIHGYSQDERRDIENLIDVVFLDRALNKDCYVKFKDCTNEGSYTLTEYYLASAVTICLLFVAIVIMPLMMGHKRGITILINARGLNSFHIFSSNVFSALLCVYIAFLPCFVGVSIATKNFHAIGLLSAIPYIFIIAIIIALVAHLGKGNMFTGNMIVLFVTLILAYVGGGIIPRAMLPSIVKDISNILPGRFMITGIANSLFG